MKRLIVNADDLGADAARNRGIFEAVEAGAVTSVSLLANGPAFEDAVERLKTARGKAVSVGFHINLSQGKPLSGNLRLLTGPQGDFLGKAGAHALLMRRRDRALEGEIAREIDAQIAALLRAGISPDHADGHQHVHVFPAVIEVALRAARRHGIRWMRMPEEPTVREADEALAAEGASFSALARDARPLLAGTPVRTTDSFRGLYWKGTFSIDRLDQMLADLPAGLTELMVHPGRADSGTGEGPFSYFSTGDRQRELEALLDESFGKTLARQGVRLVSYAEVPV